MAVSQNLYEDFSQKFESDSILNEKIQSFQTLFHILLN
jgi:hypothetical protein